MEKARVKEVKAEERDGVYIRGSKRWLRPVEILGFHYFFFILFSLISL
jgi:hypothetical protein